LVFILQYFRVVTAGERPAHQGGITCGPRALYCGMARQQSEWVCRNEKRVWKEDETTASLLSILARAGKLRRETCDRSHARMSQTQSQPNRPEKHRSMPYQPDDDKSFRTVAAGDSPYFRLPPLKILLSIVPDALGVINTNTAPPVPPLGSLFLRPHPWPLLLSLPPCLRSSCHRGSSRRVDTTSSYLISTPCWPSQTKAGDPAATAYLSDQSRAVYTRLRKTRLLGTCPSWQYLLSTSFPPSLFVPLAWGFHSPYRFLWLY
jgi:hypothetical protein